MASATLRSAVLGLSADTDHAYSVLKTLGACERSVFFTTLKALNISRWAVLVDRFATQPAYSAEHSAEDIDTASSIAASLLLEVAA